VKKVATNQLAPGMKVALKIENQSGMVILPEGIELTEALIGRLKKLGVQEVWVEGADEAGGGAIAPDLSGASPEFIAKLTHKFELVKDDPVMQGIYNSVLAVISKKKG